MRRMRRGKKRRTWRKRRRRKEEEEEEEIGWVEIKGRGEGRGSRRRGGGGGGEAKLHQGPAEKISGLEDLPCKHMILSSNSCVKHNPCSFAASNPWCFKWFLAALQPCVQAPHRSCSLQQALKLIKEVWMKELRSVASRENHSSTTTSSKPHNHYLYAWTKNAPLEIFVQASQSTKCKTQWTWWLSVWTPAISVVKNKQTLM